jgi:hypothetical protein
LTDICFRYLGNSRPGAWTTAVRNHVDVDAILSVRLLVHRQHALAHGQTMNDAAEIGDFWCCGEATAQMVFQGFTRSMNSDEVKEVYAKAFRRTPALVEGTDPAIQHNDESRSPQWRGVELVERESITVPKGLDRGDGPIQVIVERGRVESKRAGDSPNWRPAAGLRVGGSCDLAGNDAGLMTPGIWGKFIG